MVEHTCNSRTQEAEAGGSRCGDQAELQSETLSQQTKQDCII
jgi:hypothetical protein